MKNVYGVLSLLKNKYTIASIGFIVWMLFFDPKDWPLIKARANKLQELKQSEKFLTAKIKETEKELNFLKTDAGSIERYAREKFYMKKDNEDLFIMKTP